RDRHAIPARPLSAPAARSGTVCRPSPHVPKILPGLVRYLGYLARDAFAFDEMRKQLSGGAAAWIDGGDLAAQPPDNARHVDSTAARVAAGGGAPHLVGVHHPLDRCRYIDSGIWC